jgi:hypothetical protein
MKERYLRTPLGQAPLWVQAVTWLVVLLFVGGIIVTNLELGRIQKEGEDLINQPLPTSPGSLPSRQ